MKSIGIIGLGVVGNALKEGMSHAFEVQWNDIEKGGVPIFQIAQEVKGPIFICVPTPISGDGLSCDTSIVESVVAEIQQGAIYTEYAPTVVIKSTVPPGTTETLQERYYLTDLCFNPEFLTEKSPVEDFKSQDRIIIGKTSHGDAVVSRCYEIAYPNVPQIHCGSKQAEMVKYVTNVHLATKVALANEFKQICDSVGISYDDMIKVAKMDDRLGESHWQVPGPDGYYGFGGTCFPKDLRALISLAFACDVQPVVMLSALKKNIEVREDNND